MRPGAGRENPGPGGRHLPVSWVYSRLSPLCPGDLPPQPRSDLTQTHSGPATWTAIQPWTSDAQPCPASVFSSAKWAGGALAE